MASAGTLYVDVLPDTRYFGMALRTSMNRAVAGSTMKNLGSIMSRGLVVGAAAAGAASVKMALDFNQSMTRIAALTNTGSKNMQHYQDVIMSLSGQTARSPKELADALYYLASAGLRNNQILPALKASAEGAAVGLGTTADVSRVVINALNAYAGSNLTASHAVDILTAATREGTVAPDEMAQALGRILPIASAAGVGFDQVAASLATVSNIGLNAYEGTTAMRGVLQSIVAPTKTASAALAQLGLSGAALRDVLTKKGLLAAMDLLWKRSGGNLDTMKAIIPNIRALVGELGNVGQAADKVNGIYQRVIHSQGDLGKAMSTTAASPAFQFRQALTDMSNILLDVGQNLLPSVLHALQDLVPVLKFAADNAALLVSAFAGFKALAFLPGLFSSIASAVGTIGAATLGEALGPVAILPQLIQDNMSGTGVSDIQDNASAANKLFDLYKQGKISMVGFAAAQAEANARLNDSAIKFTPAQIAALKQFNNVVDQYTSKSGNNLGNTLAANNEAFGQAEDKILAYNQAQKDNIATTKMYTEYQAGVTKMLDQQAKTVGHATQAVHAQTGEANRVIDNFNKISGTNLDLGVLGKMPTPQLLESVAGAWQSISDKIAGSIGNIYGAFDELSSKSKVSFADVSKALHSGLADVKSFGHDLTVLSRDAKQGVPGAQALVDHLVQLGPAGVKMADALAGASAKARHGLERQIGAGLKSVGSISDQITKAMVGSMEHVAAAILVATGQARTFAGALAMLHDVNVNVTANTDPAYTNVRDFIAWTNSQSAHVTVVMDQYTALHGRPPGKTQAGGPVYTNRSTWVGERGPELFVPNIPGHIVPNPDPHNWGHTTRGAQGRMTVIQGKLTIDENGQAFIRGLAREETNAELAYRRLG